MTHILGEFYEHVVAAWTTVKLSFPVYTILMAQLTKTNPV